MNLFIYVLLLSIWTTNCLNISTSNGSSNTGPPEPKKEKLDSFRRHLLNVITGIMLRAFFFTCFCLIHYNCMIEPSKENMVKKEGIEVKSSWPSILPLSESKTKDLNLCIPEKQALLSNIGNLSRPSSTEKPSISSNAEKLIKQSSSINSFKSPSLTELLRPSYLKKSCRTHLKETHKLAYAHKQAAQVSSPYQAMPVRIPLQASLQSLGRPNESPYPENQILPPKAMTLAKPPENHHLKMLGSIGEAGMVSKPLSGRACQLYEEKCLVCKTSEILANNISEEKNKNAGYLPVSSEMMSFSRTFHEVDAQDHAYFANVSGNDVIDDSDDDSDREITIICSITSKDLFSKGTSK